MIDFPTMLFVGLYLFAFGILVGKKVFSKVIEKEIKVERMYIEDYNPDKDILVFRLGTDTDIPPNSVFEKLKKDLEKITPGQSLIVPGCIHVEMLRYIRGTKNGEE